MTDSPVFPPEDGPLSGLTRAVAVLRLGPEELQVRAGLRCEVGHDDLNDLDWAEVRGAAGRRYALVCHRHALQPGTEVVTSFDSPDPQEDVRDVLRQLGLNDEDVIWRSDERLRAPEASRRPVAGS